MISTRLTLSATAIAPAPAIAVKIGAKIEMPQVGQPKATNPNIAPIPPVLAPSIAESFSRFRQVKTNSIIVSA